MTTAARGNERTLSNFPTSGPVLRWWEIHDYCAEFRSRWTCTDQHGQPYPEVAYHMMAALDLSSPEPSASIRAMSWVCRKLGFPPTSPRTGSGTRSARRPLFRSAWS